MIVTNTMKTSAGTDKRLSFPDKTTLRKQYDDFLERRKLAMGKLQLRVEEALDDMALSLMVKTRVKDFKSYFKKYLRLLEKGEYAVTPLINDIIGMRIVCPFMEDRAVVEKLLKEKFEVTEVERKGIDHTFREFGYESVHILVKFPQDIIDELGSLGCEVAEIQIRTILQDAWAEVEHELIYKTEFNPVDEPLKRKLAAVNASLTLADIIFQEIRGYIRNLNEEFGKRRKSFFRKIEQSTDALIFEEEEVPDMSWSAESTNVNAHLLSGGTLESIDDLLLEALTAHNKNLFSEAIVLYSRILELDPDALVRSLIYKHRGMAFFAQSDYEKALADFVKSLELDPKSYKSAYYQGIILSVQKDYPKALDAFNMALDIYPYQPYCLYRRGQVYFHLEDYPKALADCEAALSMEPFEGAEKFRQLVLSKLKL